MLDVLNVFHKTKHLALDCLEDESEFTPQLPPLGPPTVGLRFSTLRLRDVTGAEGILASFALSGLRKLSVEYTAHKTLRWLAIAAPIMAPTLEILAITAIPDTFDPKRGAYRLHSDHPAF